MRHRDGHTTRAVEPNRGAEVPTSPVSGTAQKWLVCRDFAVKQSALTEPGGEIMRSYLDESPELYEGVDENYELTVVSVPEGQESGSTRFASAADAEAGP